MFIIFNKIDTGFYPFGHEEDFGDTERHNFYRDTDHVQQDIRGDIDYDQAEQDGPNKAWRHQHDMGPAFTYEELYRKSLPAETE